MPYDIYEILGSKLPISILGPPLKNFSL